MTLNEARKKLEGRGGSIGIKNVKNKIICRSGMSIDDETMLKGHKR